MKFFIQPILLFSYQRVFSSFYSHYSAVIQRESKRDKTIPVWTILSTYVTPTSCFNHFSATEASKGPSSDGKSTQSQYLLWETFELRSTKFACTWVCWTNHPYFSVEIIGTAMLDSFKVNTRLMFNFHTYICALTIDIYSDELHKIFI